MLTNELKIGQWYYRGKDQWMMKYLGEMNGLICFSVGSPKIDIRYTIELRKKSFNTKYVWEEYNGTQEFNH